MSRKRVFTDEELRNLPAEELADLVDAFNSRDYENDAALIEAARRLRLLGPHESPDLEDCP